MRETAAFTLFGILCFTVFGQCWISSRPAPPPRSGVPVVLVTQDMEHHLLTISGPGLGNGKPLVRLGAENLPVERCTPDEIVARLPDGIKPDMYVLTVAGDGENRHHDTILYASGG